MVILISAIYRYIYHFWKSYFLCFFADDQLLIQEQQLVNNLNFYNQGPDNRGSTVSK